MLRAVTDLSFCRWEALVEIRMRFFNKIKQCRRVATRYDKLAVNYLAFVQLASIAAHVLLQLRRIPSKCCL